jgi:hypothetical protein
LTLLLVVAAVAAGGWYGWEQPSATVVARVRVVLLPPAGGLPNALAETTSSLVSLAGVVARGVEGFGGAVETVDSQISLASQGVRTGYSVRQPNLGGQWDSAFSDPAVDVQAVGPTQEVAAVQLGMALARIGDVLTELQDRESVPADLRVRVRLSPADPVYEIQKGSRTRAVAATGLAGIMAAGAWVAWRRASSDRGARRSSGDAAR